MMSRFALVIAPAIPVPVLRRSDAHDRAQSAGDDQADRRRPLAALGLDLATIEDCRGRRAAVARGARARVARQVSRKPHSAASCVGLAVDHEISQGSYLEFAAH